MTEAPTHAYDVHALSGLDEARADKGHLIWDGPRSLWTNIMFLGALILPLFYTSVTAIAVGLSLGAITLCLGHSIGFHRRLVHRSFQCPQWLDHTLIYLGVLVGIGGPLWTLRLHDTRDWGQRQTNSHPLLRHGYPFMKDGLLYLNMRLVLDHPPRFTPCAEIAHSRFYRWLDQTWILHQIALALILYALGGMAWVTWGIFVRVSASIFMHWAISYLAHTRGPSDWAVKDASVQGNNIAWLTIPTMGESWHGNHYAFPTSARHGLYPGQIDPGWWVIQGLEALNLVWDVQTPHTLPPRTNLIPLTKRAQSFKQAHDPL